MTNKVEEKLREEINKELGYISALFMSQGDTRAGDIVMPSTELQEALDRIMLYVFGYQSQALTERDREVIELIATEEDCIKSGNTLTPTEQEQCLKVCRNLRKRLTNKGE